MRWKATISCSPSSAFTTNRDLPMNEPNPPPSRSSAMPGLAAIGLVTTGLAGLVHTLLTGSVLGLFAAVLAFGVIFVISFR